MSAAPPAPPFTPTVQFRLPWVGGQIWKVTQDWHEGSNISYYAYDFGPPTMAGKNLPIVAAAAGTVKFVSEGDTTCGPDYPTDPCGTDDNSYVVIKHTDGSYSAYVHLNPFTLTIGSSVAQGQAIGQVDAIGEASGPHLHFDRKWTPAEKSSYEATTWYSMKTSFAEVYGSGTVASPNQLTQGAWYKSENSCSLASENTALLNGAFCARYYRDRGLEDYGTTTEDKYAAVMSRQEPTIYHPDWATSGFPESSYSGRSWTFYDGYWANDEFGAKYAGRFNFYADVWTFFVTASDGVEVRIDGVLYVSTWTVRSTDYVYQFDKQMTSGYHTIEVEYFNSGSTPKLSVTWQDCDIVDC